MKKNKFRLSLVLLSVTTVLLSFFIFTSKTINPVFADDNRTYLGRSFKYTHVSTTTKVYLFYGDQTYNMVASSGRTIYNEIVRDFSNNDTDEYVIDDSNLVNHFGAADWYNRANPGMIVYYYYATPSEPLLTGFHDMYNDVSSLIYALQILQTEASYLGISDVNNAVLSYVRCLASEYDDIMWSTIAGGKNTTLINGMNYLNVGGLEVNEFFASFLQDSTYNPSYKTCSMTHLTKHLPLLDSFNTEIDLIHLFASLDGVYDETGMFLEEPISYIITPASIKFLASWAGDLQTETVFCSDENISVSVFDFEGDVLSNDVDGTMFSYMDYYADVDAIIMAGEHNLSDISSISSAIDYYYNYVLLQSSFDRNDEFKYRVCHMADSDFTFVNTTLHLTIYDMLALDASGNSNVVPEGQYGGNVFPKYYLLGFLNPSHNFIMPDSSFRLNMANSFYWYMTYVA